MQSDNIIIRATTTQLDAIIAALRLLAAELDAGRVSPNDGDIGDILTCSGAHSGMSAYEITGFCDSLLF